MLVLSRQVGVCKRTLPFPSKQWLYFIQSSVSSTPFKIHMLKITCLIFKFQMSTDPLVNFQPPLLKFTWLYFTQSSVLVIFSTLLEVHVLKILASLCRDSSGWPVSNVRISSTCRIVPSKIKFVSIRGQFVIPNHTQLFSTNK